MTFHASNGHKVERSESGAWYDVIDTDNPAAYWTMDTEDMDLEYAEQAIQSWTAWREFLLSEGRGSTERTGRLKARTLVMTWKRYDNIPGNDRNFYSEAEAPIRWDGVRSSAGYEDYYGGRTLLWTDVWNEELAGWMSKGLSEEEVEWDD